MNSKLILFFAIICVALIMGNPIDEEETIRDVPEGVEPGARALCQYWTCNNNCVKAGWKGGYCGVGDRCYCY